VGPLLLLLLQDPRCGHQQPLGVPDPQPCFVPNRIASEVPQPLFEVPQSHSYPTLFPSSFGSSRSLEEHATGFLPVPLQPYQDVPRFPQPHGVPIQFLQQPLVPTPQGRNRSSSTATLDSLRPKSQRSTVLKKTAVLPSAKKTAVLPSAKKTAVLPSAKKTAVLPSADPFLGVLALLSTPRSQPTFLGKASCP
jgi:hypothetical protein